MLFSVLSREVSTPKSGEKGKAAMWRFSFWDCMAKVMGGCICLKVLDASAGSPGFEVATLHLRSSSLLPTFQEAQSTKWGLENLELVYRSVAENRAFPARRPELPADLDDLSTRADEGLCHVNVVFVSQRESKCHPDLILLSSLYQSVPLCAVDAEGLVGVPSHRDVAIQDSGGIPDRKTISKMFPMNAWVTARSQESSRNAGMIHLPRKPQLRESYEIRTL